ncbi:hypothetical protein [Amnibacterium soli]|uniref:hypothetical protein n=1 Tax=Amnibacterium soli TaxID=1282736 RepID=UPI0031E85DB6
MDPLRASLITRRRAIKLSERARAGLDRPPVKDDGPEVLRSVVVGMDPVRVLLFGSGPFVGYGVTARKDAVDGPLAALLARRTGRGVVVESRVRLGLPTGEAVGSLGGAGTATFHAAVWAPRFGEELQHSNAEHSRTSVRAFLQAFRAESDIPLILCHLPVPLGLDWRTVLRRPRVARYNQVLDEQALAARDVFTADGGSYHPVDPAHAPDASWHRELAIRIAPPVLHAIGHSAPGEYADPFARH